MDELNLHIVAIKAVGDWELDVLGVPYGGPFEGKDRQKEYFDQNTKIYEEFYKEIPAVYAHGRQPSGRPAEKPVVIGKARYSHRDEKGHWYRVVLDKLSEFAKRVWDAAKSGNAAASSGSIAHLTRVQPDGRITEWPVAEMTLVDVGSSNLLPVNPYAVALPVMKAVYDQAGLTMPELENQPTEGNPEATGEGDEQPGAVSADGGQTTVKTIGGNEMDKEEMLKLLDERDAQKAAEALKVAEAARVKELEDENAKLKEEAAKARRLPGGAPYVTQFADTDKFDHYSAADLGLAIETLQSAKAPVSGAAIKALMLKVAHIENDKVSAETAAYAKSALKARLNGVLTDDAIKTTTADVNYTTGSSHLGEDWVGTAYSNQIWEKIRANANIVAKIPAVTIPDGFASNVFPLESTDPTWYEVAQASTTDDTLGVPGRTVTKGNVVTDDTSITVKKMGASVNYSGEMTEDSLLPFVAQVRMQLEKSGSEMMEHVVIDGDTATSSNINDIGGTTYSGAATSLFLHTNGFRKVGIANGRSAAGAFSVEDFLATAKLLGVNGIGMSDPSQIAFIVDPNTWFAAAQLPEAKDRNQTILNVSGGFVQNAYTVPVIASWQMHYRQASRKANTAGKVDLDTAGNNLYGAILAVRFDQWKLGYKRRMTMETTRYAKSDSWEITALARWGLIYRDAYAAAVTYYVGV